MARLTYSMIASLDGYVADETGRFDWAAPDEEVHGFINELDRPVGTCSSSPSSWEGTVHLHYRAQRRGGTASHDGVMR